MAMTDLERSPGVTDAGPMEVGVTRRGFMKAGSAALAALAGSDLMGASAGTAAVIQIYLPGGPSHLDTFDPKPIAPSTIRGEFRSITTTVPRLRFCEHLPRLASLARYLTVVRGLTGLHDAHDPGPFDSGTTTVGRPGLGAILAHQRGAMISTLRGEIPTAVDLSGWTTAGPLGQRVAPRRLGSRRAKFRHVNELCTATADEFTVTGSEPLSRALNLRQESAQTWERYGAADHAENVQFLRARRLIEAGVRCVAFAWGYWDTHGDNFGQLRRQLPPFDQGLSALIDDLRTAGRLDDVVIVAGGEFGRTPRINDGAGRDHWTHAAAMLLAGGGLPHGRSLGATDRSGAEPTEAVRLDDVFALVYHRLGIHSTKLPPADRA